MKKYDKCICINNPEGYSFEKGKTYQFGYIIDGIYVIDDNNKEFSTDEIHFLWFFKMTD